MEHLYSISAYPFDIEGYGTVADAVRRITDAGADGIELLTGYFHPDLDFKGIAKGVHLPYATDWYSVWVGDTGYIDRVKAENIRYRSYGRNRNEMAEALRDAVAYASSVSPAYGVLHASNVRMNEVMGFSYTDGDNEVVSAVADLLNAAAERFPGGEPPFRIVLENLWWPGLSMTDSSGFRILERELAFADWGLCLDTGHLMNRLGRCRDEEKSIKDVLRIVKKYPKKMKDRIDVVHLHMSLSADYTDMCRARPAKFAGTDDEEIIMEAYEHVCRMDQHRPFTDPVCRDIVNTIGPKYVTHEISGPTPAERLSGFAWQRSLFRE